MKIDLFVKIGKAIDLIKRGYRAYTKSIVLLLILGILNSLLEGIGVTALIPLFGLATNSPNLGDDFISKTLKEVFAYLHIDFSLKFVLFFVLIMFLLKFVIVIVSHIFRIYITTKYHEDMMRQLFGNMVGASWDFLLKQKVGYVNNLLFLDVVYARQFLQKISNIIVLSASTLIYVVIAFNISSVITGVTVVFGIFILFLFKGSVFKIKRDAYAVNICNKKVAHFVNEQVIGMKTTKIMAISHQIRKKGFEFFYQLRRLRTNVLLRKKITGAILEPISIVYVLFIFAIYYKTPGFNLPSFVVIVFLIQRIFQQVKETQGSLHRMGEAFPYVKKMLDYIDISKEYRERDDGHDEFVFNKTVEFKDVHFSYGNKKEVLNKLNFKIAKGETVGIVGPSGGGKTTIVDLISRLFYPDTGEILLDGKNIRDVDLDSWRKKMGYVTQDIFLINGSVERNITFYDETISHNDVIKAAQMANIYDAIQEKPKGFDTIVGERGIELSVGQRQRIVIARALARKPEILIFDEATSALDNESEQAIKEIIQTLKKKMTIIIIAHRLSTVMNCDNVFVLEKGVIVEQGSPESLLSDNNSYFSRNYNLI